MAVVHPENLRYFGTTELPERTRLLKAGGLSAEFIAGALCNIRYHGREVLRSIAYLVRDRNWGTYVPEIANLHIVEDDAFFSISYDAHCHDHATGQLLRYRASIGAEACGELHFAADFMAQTRFLTCRNGFCVLHPITGLAGQPVVVGHPGGVTEESRFPAEIAPWQPFKEMESITWHVADGVAATCRMQGDVFEMEDQRNWSDASYKTYVRPLERPWPYWMEPGESGSQSVSLRVSGGDANVSPPDATQVASLSLLPMRSRHPAIGITLTPETSHAGLRELDHLRALGPQVLLCQFDPDAGDDVATLSDYAAIAAQYCGRYVLEYVLPGTAAPGVELNTLATQLQQARMVPDAIAISPAVDRTSVPPGSPWPSCPSLAQVYTAARAGFPGIRLGGGTFSYFTELNRKRPPFQQLDWVTHATNPIVHAASDASVMQTLEAIPHITRSCRALIGPEQPYWIGPVTLAMRQNPYGSKTMDNPASLRIPMANTDPRERALFGAAWMLGYAAQVADAELEVLTFGPLTGPRGLLGPPPDASHADTPVQPHPAFHIVRALARLAGNTRLQCRSSLPDTVLGLGAIDAAGNYSLWVVNLTQHTQSFRLDGGTPSGARVRQVLDSQGWRTLSEPAPAGRIDIMPYACMELSWQETLDFSFNNRKHDNV